jgi:hypothetical protein
VIVLLAAAVLLGVLVAGVVVVVASVLGGDRRRSFGGGAGAGALVAVAAAIGVVLLVAIVGVATLGVARGRSAPSSPAQSTAGSPPEQPSAKLFEQRAIEGMPASYDDFVALDRLDTELLVPEVVDGLADGDVVQVSGRGFGPNVSGSLAQCDGGAASACTNVVDVQTDGEGTFRTPYRVVGGTARWALVVDVGGDRRVALLDFGDLPARPVSRLRDDELVVTGVPPTGLVVVRCDADAVELDGCREVHRVAPGEATARLDLPALGGRSPTEVSLVLLDGNGIVLDEPIGFRAGVAPPAVVVSPDRPPLRRSVGLTVAALLLAIAVVLVRRTDWRVPAEGAVPDVELDLA